jgi:UDP-N-acetylglucosamine--N-acetylmuramyl-(pentapeptide) pyrophosphoryl-undecaprenol N-acetylglucosamine transferase
MTNFLLTGGGTAGHVNPLLSLADAITAQDAQAKVIALGTAEGLESGLVPARGYRLETIERLPFPRKPSAYALGFPFKFLRAVGQVRALIRKERIETVVGFGGYASAPAYLAARFEKIPLVIHEANALPGIANKIGAKFADVVAVAFAGTGLPREQLTGMPLRHEIEAITIRRNQSEARKHFGLDENTLTLLVTGGSLGAKKLNDVIEASRTKLAAAGIQVLHIVGGKSDLAPIAERGYVRLAYCDRMDLAIAAADFAVSRAGASTVSEFAAVGLPAVYVPYAVGNGEQRFNLQTLLKAGGGVMVLDKDFDEQYVASQLIPLLSSAKQLKEMAKAAASVGIKDGTQRLLQLVLSVLRKGEKG